MCQACEDIARAEAEMVRFCGPEAKYDLSLGCGIDQKDMCEALKARVERDRAYGQIPEEGEDALPRN